MSEENEQSKSDKDLLQDLKIALGIDESDTSDDDVIKLVIRQTKQRLLTKLKIKSTEEVPTELEYILFEVSIRRFNRINNEGMKSYSQDGENVTFNDDDFIGFENEISQYLSDNDKSQMPTANFYNPYTFGNES